MASETMPMIDENSIRATEMTDIIIKRASSRTIFIFSRKNLKIS
jgi:hypothetical protein